MWTIRPAAERGHADHGWLNTHHTFSFAAYHDPEHMGFGPLRVINDDRVAGGAGFGTHPHQDMEIITYVLDGALRHKDTTGGGGVIRPGDVQHMSAGTGVLHSEFNADPDEEVHFLQIWVLPERRGKAPAYHQIHVPLDERQGTLRLVASPDGALGSIAIGQDAKLYASVLAPGQAVSHTLAPGRGSWVHVARGDVRLDDQSLSAGDGASRTQGGTFTLEGAADGAEVLVFDLG